MAVYTDVAAEDLARFLAGYDVGELRSYKGNCEGVENSNFWSIPAPGNFILDRSMSAASPSAILPFYPGLMEHLASRASPARSR